MTLLGTAAVLVSGVAVLIVVVWVLTIIPGFTITAGPFPYGSTHDLFEVHGRQDVLTLFWFCSFAVLVPLTVIGGLVSWFVAGRTMRPLHDVIDTADRLDVDDLRARVPVTTAQDETQAVAIALNALLDRLEAGVAARSRFAANASHELRNPLAAVRTIAQLALQQTDDPVMHRALARIVTTNDRMGETTAALLALARSDRPADLEQFGIRVLVDDAVDTVLDRMRARHIVVLNHVDADLCAHGDRVLFAQLVRNLIDNAVRYATDGTTVTVRGHSSGPLVSVENEGDRIDEAGVALLAEPFRRRTDRVRDASEGTGLGLAIVSAVARAHGAELVLTARPAGGLLAEVRKLDERVVEDDRLGTSPTRS
jgi:signal transduction histidine kinase